MVDGLYSAPTLGAMPMNWDDLRIARAVYEAGSYAAAGARLRINETTVARRLARLQADMGVTLFEAVDGVRKPTAQCTQLVALAARMADHADRIAKIGETDVGLVGRRRIAATDSVSTEVFAPNVAAFLTDHPGLSLEFLATTSDVNFSRWEADIAVRRTKPAKGNFIISRLPDVAVYFFAPADAGPDPDALVWVYPDDMDSTAESQYLMRRGLYQRARLTTRNLLVARTLIQSKRFCGILPSYMCAGLLDDKTLRATRLAHRRESWLLVQTHLKTDPATRTVIDWIRDCFAALD